jgi:fatty-acid desaturase
MRRASSRCSERKTSVTAHNNHHGDPRAAIYGRRWWEIDPTWTLIRLLEIMRLARHVHRPRRMEARTESP